ncbi:hypothetical protein [Bradyrhizobium frederickii]|uniref:hypothetical protein n=1 Tax=Bradyrhizobium frederickii TaxID=2560054 RepID=UPI003221AB08
MTEPIQFTGTAKRSEASSTKAANWFLVFVTVRTAAALLSATAAPCGTGQMSSSEARTQTRAHNWAKHAVVPAPVQGNASPRRVFGRPGPPLRAAASRTLIEVEE